MYQSFQKQASLDQVFYPANELVTYKIAANMKRLYVVRYFKVPGFGRCMSYMHPTPPRERRRFAMITPR